MPELFADAFRLFPLTLAPALLVLMAPWLGRRGRGIAGALLILAGLALVVDVLVLDHSGTNTLAVPNLFPRGEKGEPFEWTVATSTAPAWHWHVFLAAMLALPGLLLVLRRGRAPGSPSPVPFGVLVFLWYFVARLGLEHFAVHKELAWAIGGTPALVLMLPFFGAACGARGYSFRAWGAALLAMALLQRIVVIAWGYVATTRELGTHLDTHVVTDINVVGMRTLETSFDRWWWPTGLPHLTLWIVLTMVAGFVLGAVPFFVARARARLRIA